MSDYPVDFDSWRTSYVAGVDKVPAADFDGHADSINQMQETVGLEPQGQYASVADRLQALEFQTTRTITSSDSVQATDSKGVIIANASSTVLVSIPDDQTLFLNTGAEVDLFQLGIGQVAFQPLNSSVSVVNSLGYSSTRAQYSVIRARKFNDNLWVISGDVGAITLPPVLVPPNGSQLPLMLGMNSV